MLTRSDENFASADCREVRWWVELEAPAPAPFTNPFHYEPHPLCLRAYEELMERDVMSVPDFREEIEKGKMFGILIVGDGKGKVGYLAAFSGQIKDSFRWPGFVPAVLDYLDENGYFKKGEIEVSALNRDIETLEKEKLPKLEKDLRLMEEESMKYVEKAKREMTEAKARRDAKRASWISPEEENRLIRESQYLKAELHRAKKRARECLGPFIDRMEECKKEISQLKVERHIRSGNLQSRLFSDFKMLNAEGESKDLNAIFSEFNGSIPPSGSGECCAPKLLQYAYLHGLQPLAMSEFWYGSSPNGEIRIHGAHYPACRSKCLPILTWMLKGLDVAEGYKEPSPIMPRVVYENSDFCVVDKPPGLLSVPGKGRVPSVVSLMKEKYQREVYPAHRLDQDTSGLLILAFTPETQRQLQHLFASREVRKTYVAVLDGDFAATGLPLQGKIELPIGPDITDRPRQKVDHQYGKRAITSYRVVKVENGMTQIEFLPLTGRTHQLRVHSASTEGLGLPIAGDRLYYRPGRTLMSRMLLHACRIEFTYPHGAQIAEQSSADCSAACHYSFTSPLPADFRDYGSCQEENYM